MKTREIIEISTIVILVAIVVQILPNQLDKNFPSIDLQKNELSRTNQNSALANAQSLQLENNTSASSYILDYNNQLTQIFKKVENSVVQITSKVSTVNSHIIINGNPLEQQSTRLGSGFVYDINGHIITNNHVVDGANTVDVSFVNGDTYTAKVIGTDPHSDIAVLQIIDDTQYEKLIPIPLGDSLTLQVGQYAIAIGNPYGLSNTMTTGIISQTGRILPNPELGFSIPNVIQTDAAINPGNSGGPLLNINGEVIGMNTAIQSKIGEFSGVGFAVPSNTIKQIVPALIEKGIFPHPWLGITGTTLNSELAQNLKLPPNFKGIAVNQVVKNSPAEKAGLKEATYNASGELKQADVIIALDGNEMKRIDDLIAYIFESKNVDDSMTITVNRDGKVIELKATLEARPN